MLVFSRRKYLRLELSFYNLALVSFLISIRVRCHVRYLTISRH